MASHGAIRNYLLRDTNAVREEQQAMEIETHKVETYICIKQINGRAKLI